MVLVSYMIRRDYLIVGAGIGGASACAGIRKYDKRGSVTLVGAEAFPPYKRWILSKSFLREKEANPKKLQEVDERSGGTRLRTGRHPTLRWPESVGRRLSGTWEPAAPMQKEKLKWKNHESESTDAEPRGGTTRSSGEVPETGWSKGVVSMELNSMCQPGMGGADE